MGGKLDALDWQGESLIFYDLWTNFPVYSLWYTLLSRSLIFYSRHLNDSPPRQLRLKTTYLPLYVKSLAVKKCFTPSATLYICHKMAGLKYYASIWTPFEGILGGPTSLFSKGEKNQRFWQFFFVAHNSLFILDFQGEMYQKIKIMTPI